MAAAHLALSGRIAVIAKKCDLAELDAYIASDKFMALFADAEPAKRGIVFAAYNTARQSCITRIRIAKAGTRKANWKKPGEIDRFKRTWEKLNGNPLLVASAMRITEGAAVRAHLRFMVHGATATYPHPVKGAGKPQESRSVPGVPSGVRDSNHAAAPLSVAA